MDQFSQVCDEIVGSGGKVIIEAVQNYGPLFRIRLAPIDCCSFTVFGTDLDETKADALKQLDLTRASWGKVFKKTGQSN